jgi:hypothetical protein
MKTNADTLYFVLRDGATKEEQWSWEAIKEMCASGQFSPDTRIFFSDKNAWVCAGDTELKAFFGAVENRSQIGEGAVETNEDREALESEYNEVLRRVGAKPELIEGYIEAGRLATELNDRQAATRHFQTALDLQPFNARVVQEIKRRFSKAECRDFRCFEREAPVWDNLHELVTYPLSRDIRYPGITAAVTAVFLFIPYGGYVVGVLYFLWCMQVARQTAAGSVHLPLWHPAFADPVRELILPLVAGSLVLVEFFLVFGAIARLSMLVGQENTVSVLEYLRNSPILVVLMSVVGIAYLPAVFVRMSNSVGMMIGLLNPWKIVRLAVRMEQEYLMSVFMLFAVGLAVGVLRLLMGGIPILGKAVLAASIAYTLPIAGFIFGRLLARMRHVL